MSENNCFNGIVFKIIKSNYNGFNSCHLYLICGASWFLSKWIIGYGCYICFQNKILDHDRISLNVDWLVMLFENQSLSMMLFVIFQTLYCFVHISKKFLFHLMKSSQMFDASWCWMFGIDAVTYSSVE